MKILGIDPGTIVLGYGIIEAHDDQMILVTSSVLECDKRSPVGERLCYLYDGLCDIIRKHRPEVVAIEQPFFAKNARSALAIGKAQAITILAASKYKLPVYEYTPRQVKKRVAGHGGSDKEQVQEMVRVQLNLKKTPQPTDASDALAVAICHIIEGNIKDTIAEG
jgi:crossover junction endodeoxyribonuclease RuvC